MESIHHIELVAAAASFFSAFTLKELPFHIQLQFHWPKLIRRLKTHAHNQGCEWVMGKQSSREGWEVGAG